jgi:hypothetical protein
MGTTPYTLLASAARTASDVGAAIVIPKRMKAAVFLLNVTAAATEINDLLDVWIQESPDLGATTWNDILRFTQVLGNGGAKKYIATVNCEAPAERESAAVQDAAMAAGVRQGPVIPYIRPKWTVTDAGADNASFTFSISLISIR